MTSDPTPDAQPSTREMTLVYFGFAREQGASEPDAEMRRFIRNRRVVASLILVFALYAVGSRFGLVVTAVVLVVGMLWFAVATALDRRRSERNGVRRSDF